MTNPRQPHPSEDAGDVAEPGLAPTLCGSCWWGKVVRCVRALELDEINDLADGSPIRGVAREMSFCQAPSIAGAADDAQPFHFEDPVKDCESYVEREAALKLMRASARRKRDRQRRAAGRGVRRGQRRR